MQTVNRILARNGLPSTGIEAVEYELIAEDKNDLAQHMKSACVSISVGWHVCCVSS